ncbi:MAG TPA: calcium-binding protein [Actinomycetota bacterium]|nr:calcium-binding protein [Actinomycetota bacterium]
MHRTSAVVTAASLAAAVLLPVGAAPGAEGAARPMCMGKRATIVAEGGYESITGTPRADVIVGTDSTDYINGKGGNDRICAKGNYDEDEDTISGGRGDDRIAGGGGGDLVYGGPGDDRIRTGEGPDYVHAELGADVVSTGIGGDYVDGGIGWDTIDGGDGGDGILGGAGQDALDGGADHDLVEYTELCCDYSYDAGGVEVDLAAGVGVAEDGTDSLAGFESVLGSNGDDVITGDDAPNWLHAMNGDDRVTGRGDDDSIIADDIGGVGSDTVDGGAGSDSIGFGHVAVTVDLAAGTARGQGDDTLTAIETVIGSSQGDTIYGDDGPNHLIGGEYDFDGDDVIHGRGGDDVLEGAAGEDSLDGGDGFDVCTEGETIQGCESTTPPGEP